MKKVDVTIEEMGRQMNELKQQLELLEKERRLYYEGMQKYQAIFSNSPLGILHYDTDGAILDVNIEFIKIIGSSREALIGMNMFKQLKDHQLLSTVGDSLKGGIGRYEEKYSSVTANKVTPVRGIFVGLKNEDGVVTGGTGIFEDITERKQAETILQQTRENYETFFNTIDEFLFVLDVQGNIIHTNSTVIHRLGFTKEELAGKSVLMVHPEERRKEAGKIVEDMLNGKADHCPVPLITRSGIQIPVETRVSRGSWNGSPALFGVSKDISKIRLSEEKFSKLFYLNPSACGLTDLDSGVYIEINEAFSNLLGYSNKEAIGKSAVELEILTPDTINAVLTEAKKRGNTRNIEADLRAKNGEIKRVHMSAENIYIQDKKYRFTVVDDITERRKSEAELEESREKYRGLCEAAFEAIFLSEKGICIEQNLAAEKMFGYTSAEAIGRYGTEWIVPEDREMVMKNMLAGYEEPYEARALRKDGTRFPCTLRGKMMHYKGKKVRVTSLTDITSIKEAEEALRIKDWAIESAINAFAITDQSGNLKYVNPAFLRLWGYDSPQEVLGKSPTSFWLMEVKASEIMGKLLLQEAWSGELIAVNKAGGLFDVKVEASVVKDSEGKPHSMLASFEDITERKRIFSYLREAKEKAEAGNRLKTAFMNNISHELRTPLNGILGFASLVVQSDISQEEKEQFYSLIKQSSDRLLRTITNYMDISLLASGNIEVSRKSFDLHKLLRHVYEKFLPLFTDKNLELKLGIPLKSETLFVVSDPELLKTIFSHLLDNALVFTGEGLICLGYQKSTRAIEFYVSDTGVGINAESIPLIFESFIQGKDVPQEGKEGSGLGLAIAQGCAKLLNGEIRVESELGKGSAFYLSIPDIGATEDLPLPEETYITPGDKANPVILVAENDAANFQLIEVMLRGSGVRVIAACNGKEAVDICRDNDQISLVLMDMKMPVLDGFEATRQIKSFRQNLPVIAVTAFALSGDEKRAIEAGCNDYLAKPFVKPVLLNKLKRHGIG
ncbi:MAG: PAS domain S-box protein [Bacteroidota bacterium]